MPTSQFAEPSSSLRVCSHPPLNLVGLRSQRRHDSHQALAPVSRRSTQQRILVVDDEASIRDLVTTALEFVGFEVAAAADGMRGLAAVADFAPDLVLLDISMPGLDGLEVCRRMRANGISTPVIFLTARDGIDDTVTGFGVGGDDYLTKPFHLKVLIARIQAVLKRANGTSRATPGRLRSGTIELDEATHDVWSGGNGSPCHRPSSSSCGTSSSTPASWCRRRRSSSTCGSSTSVATAASSRRTSPRSAARSTGTSRNRSARFAASATSCAKGVVKLHKFESRQRVIIRLGLAMILVLSLGAWISAQAVERELSGRIDDELLAEGASVVVGPGRHRHRTSSRRWPPSLPSASATGR